MTFRHNGCGGTTITPTLGYLFDVLSKSAGPDVSANLNYFPQITISRQASSPGRMFLPPEKRGIWRQRVKNRLTEKKDTQKVDGNLYNQQNDVFNHDFHHIFVLLS